MKNTTKTLLITLTMCASIHASPIFKALATTTSAAAGTLAGYHATNDVIDSIQSKDHTTAAQVATCATAGAATMAISGSYMKMFGDALKVCVPQPANPGIESFAYKTAQFANTFAHSMRFGSRGMLAGALATTAYRLCNPEEPTIFNHAD